MLLVSWVVIAAIAVFFFAHKATPFSNELWWQFATDQAAPRALRAGLVGSLLIATLVLIMAMRPARITGGVATTEDLERASAIVAAQGNPDANYVLTGDRSILFADNGRAFLMYRVQGRSWIALGDPVGDAEAAGQLVWEFYDAANAANGRAVFYEVSTAYLPLWAEMGLRCTRWAKRALSPWTASRWTAATARNCAQPLSARAATG